MKKQKLITTVFISCFMLSSWLIFSQEIEEPHLSILEKSAEKANLTKDQLGKIKKILLEKFAHEQRVKDNGAFQYNNHLMYVWDPTMSDEKIRNKFNRELTKIISKDQYKTLFAEQLEYMTDNAINLRISEISKNKALPKKKTAALAEAIRDAFYEAAFARVYYSHDGNLFWRMSEKTRMHKERVFRKAMTDLGLNYYLDGVIYYSEREENFVKDAKAIGLKEDTIEAIFQLMAEQEVLSADYDFYWGEILATSIVSFYDPNATKEAVYKDFKKKLADLITFEQFNQLFEKHMLKQIKKEAAIALKARQSMYEFSDSQKEGMENLLLEQAYELTAINAYYSYDHQLLDVKKKQQQRKAMKSEKALVEKLGFSYQGLPEKFQKTQSFIAKLIKAKVPAKNIRKILNCMYQQEDADLLADIQWIQSDMESPIIFYFEEFSKEGNKKVFRKQLNRQLTEQQFYSVFQDVLEPLIKNKVDRELQNIMGRYELQEKQKIEVVKLLNRRYKDELLYGQYYYYNYGVRDQKINAAKYKYVAALKKKMTQYGF